MASRFEKLSRSLLDEFEVLGDASPGAEPMLQRIGSRAFLAFLGLGTCAERGIPAVGINASLGDDHGKSLTAVGWESRATNSIPYFQPASRRVITQFPSFVDVSADSDSIRHSLVGSTRLDCRLRLAFD